MNVTATANELRHVAAQKRSTNPELLEAAADALDGSRPGGGALAQLDWPEVVVQAGPTRSWLSTLAETIDHFRDILFIVPVGFVWFELSQALDAYDASPDAPDFLGQWRDGFGNGGRSFGDSATIILVVLGALVALTVLSSAFAIGGSNSEANTRKRLRSLGVRTHAGLAELNASFDPAAAAQDVLDRITQPIADLSATVAQLTTMLQPTVTALGSHQNDVSEIAASAKSIGVGIEDIVASASDLRKTCADFAADSITRLDHLSTVVESAAGSGERLEAAAQGAAQHAQLLERSVDNLDAATGSLTTSAELAARTFANLRIELQELEKRAL